MEKKKSDESNRVISKEQMQAEKYTDDWGVTYCNSGRVLKEVNPKLFTCEEYTIPDGVEIIENLSLTAEAKLRKIHLPSTLRKLEVNTFIRCPIEMLELPEGITEVPGCMCEHCVELNKVVLPSTIKIIGICAFNGCIHLQKINMPDNIEFVEDGIFRYCQSLKQVRLPLSLKVVSPEMFYCSGIESIEIHQNIGDIAYWAFWGCKHLKRLVIPETVIHIGYGIVSAHEDFDGIECHTKGYHVENDALIDDENQELLCCWTQKKHYVVPECIRRIADISGNEFVETIMVKQPVELTTCEVFASDINLKRVVFHGGVTGITEQTFWNCPKFSSRGRY